MLLWETVCCYYHTLFLSFYYCVWFYFCFNFTLGQAGAVDEETFIKSFEDVPKAEVRFRQYFEIQSIADAVK